MYTQPKSGIDTKPVTLSTLAKMKAEGRKIACLTAYDASFAALEDEAGIDVVLVGDSLGMVVQGHSSTVPVTMDEMVYHTRLAARGIGRALLMADMPFMSYPDPARAVDNAARLMQEGGATVVKLEGSAGQADVVARLAENGIPVCAHLGLRPQSVHKTGGFKVQGRGEEGARRMVEDALALEGAGADVVLLECVPNAVGREVARVLRVPVIGIGAGPDVDGQILVVYDILALTPGRKPRFAKNFISDATDPASAIAAFAAAVRDGSYPAPEHCFE